jgi:hypothetical protein
MRFRWLVLACFVQLTKRVFIVAAWFRVTAGAAFTKFALAEKIKLARLQAHQDPTQM